MGNSIHTHPDLSSCDCLVAVTTEKTHQLDIKDASDAVQTRSATTTEEVHRFQLKNEHDAFWPIRSYKFLKLGHSLIAFYEEHYVRIERKGVRESEVSWRSHKRRITSTSLSSQRSTTNDKLMTEASEDIPSFIATNAITTDCDCNEKTVSSWFLHSQIAGILTSVVCSIVIVANLFVLVSVVLILLRNAKKQGHSRINNSYVFVFNLALADFFVGVTSIVNFALNEVRNGENLHTACLLQTCFLITPCMASIFTMTIISLDRYFTIMHPLKYDLFINVLKSIIITIIIWIASILIGFAPLMGWGVLNQDYVQEGSICSYLFVVDSSYVLFSLFGMFLPQLVLIIYLYVKIFRVSKKHRRKISQIHMSNVRLARSRHNSNSSNMPDYVGPTFTQSCPVTPVMPRIQVSELRSHELAQKLHETHNRPRRTVSFSPATFDHSGSNGNVSLSDSVVSLKGEDNDGEDVMDNVFEILPGSVCALKPIPKITTTYELSSSSMQSSSNNKKNSHKLRRTVSYGGSMVTSPLTSQLFNRLRSYGSLRKIGIKNDVKALRTVALIIGFFFVMWAPFLVVSVVQMICGSGCQLQNLVGTYLLLLGVSNSAINPLVYTYTNRELKKHISLFCCKKARLSIVTDHEPSITGSLHKIQTNNSNDLLTVPTTGWCGATRNSSSSSGGAEASDTQNLSSRTSVISVSAAISPPGRCSLNRSRSNFFSSNTNESVCLDSSPNVCKAHSRSLLPPSGRKSSVCNRPFVRCHPSGSCENLLENIHDI